MWLRKEATLCPPSGAGLSFLALVWSWLDDSTFGSASLFCVPTALFWPHGCAPSWSEEFWPVLRRILFYARPACR